MNARQYFYRNVMPRFTGMSYQKAMKIQLSENDKEAKKIYRHIPKYSNDRIVEGLIKDLLKNHIPQTFKNRLEHIFVAKLRNHEYQAAALIKPGEFRGDLIYYHVGLADCLYEFLVYFFEFADSKTDASVLKDHGLRLSLMAQDWKKNQPLTIDLDPTLVVMTLDDKLMARSATIAVLTDKFVLCHEIAHHILGHTGKNNDAFGLLDKLPEELKSWKNKSVNHAKEFQADALATLFMMKLNENNMVQGAIGESQDAFEAILGCMLVLQVNNYLSNDPDEGTSTHPSDNERVNSCLAIFSHFSNPKFSGWVNAQLIIMFAFLKLTEEYVNLIEKRATEREIKSMVGKLNLLLHVRNGIK